MFYRVDIPNGLSGFTTHRAYINNPGTDLGRAWADAGEQGRVYESPNTLNWVEIERPISTDGPWVSIVFVDGDDYDTAVDEANNNGGSTDAVVEYLSQWDMGEETDGAQTRDVAPWGAGDTLHSVTHGGISYVLGINHHMGYYSLNRRPLKPAEPCNCEHINHFEGDAHAHLGVPSDPTRLMPYVGAVCIPCADTCWGN